MKDPLPANCRVRWYDMGSEVELVVTGLGIIIDSEPVSYEDGSFIYVVLCDNGEIQHFHENDIEYYEEWKDEV